MRIFSAIFAITSLTLAACGDDATDPVDSTTDTAVTETTDTSNDGIEIDTGFPGDDTNQPDTTPNDTGSPEVLDTVDATADVDTTPADTEPADTADTTPGDTGEPADTLDTVDIEQPDGASAQIQALLDAGAGGSVGLDLLVQSATVTLTKPAFGNESPGFFIQAEASGPAIFVAYTGPETITRNDVVTFRATGVALAAGIVSVSTLTDLDVAPGGGDADRLIQDVSAQDVAAGLASLLNEHIAIEGTIAGPFAGAGQGFVSAQITTAGNPTAGDTLRLRLPATLADQLALSPGCTFSVTRGVMWRFLNAAGTFNQAQPSVFEDFDILAECDGPRLVSAAASSATEVFLTFDKPLAAASVNASGAQFTISGGLTVSAATVTGASVKLTTSAQAPGTSYTVTVAASVTDVAGRALEAGANSASFSGFAGLIKLLINEIDYDQPGDDVGEFVEIYNPNPTAVDLGGFSLQLINGDEATAPVVYQTLPLSGSLKAGGYAVVAAPGLNVTADLTIRFTPANNNLQNGPRDGARIVTTAGLVIDALMYETPANADPAVLAYAEGVPFAGGEGNGEPNQSVSRCPNAADSGDNKTDFALSDSPTPGAANVCPAP